MNERTGPCEKLRERRRKGRNLKKEKSWEVFRECTAIIKENREKWLERQEAEKPKMRSRKGWPQ